MQDINPMPGLNPPLTITCAWLAQHGACKDQADLFEKLWPDGAVVTKDTLARAARAGLSLEWLAEKVLPPALYAAYLAERVPLLTDDQAKREVLDAAYYAKRAPLLAEYRAKRAPLLEEYVAKDTPLYADYEAQRNTLLIATLSAEAS